MVVEMMCERFVESAQSKATPLTRTCAKPCEETPRDSFGFFNQIIFQQRCELRASGVVFAKGWRERGNGAERSDHGALFCFFGKKS